MPLHERLKPGQRAALRLKAHKQHRQANIWPVEGCPLEGWQAYALAWPTPGQSRAQARLALRLALNSALAERLGTHAPRLAAPQPGHAPQWEAPAPARAPAGCVQGQACGWPISISHARGLSLALWLEPQPAPDSTHTIMPALHRGTTAPSANPPRPFIRLGVDVLHLSAVPDAPTSLSLAQDYFAPDLLHPLQTLKGEALRLAFAQAWVAHEARLKARGEGLMEFAPHAHRAPQAAEKVNTGFLELGDEWVGAWAVTVNGNWRLTFRFVGTDAELVDYQDYH
jgi:phosphopantetheinyl transferase